MSHRGSNLSEGVVLSEGRSAAGVLTTFSFEGGELIVCKNQDLEPDLREVQAMRERNAARAFASDIKEIGRIPEIFYSKICMIADPAERKKAVRRFFQEHPQFCAYAPYLSNSGAKRQAG
jgi:hypothetical protein